jgi:hypothetical protein
MKFILTIDTEADNQWDFGRDLCVENIRFVPRFQKLCEKYNIKPTYLVTSEVCEDSLAKEIFKDYLLGNKAEIGAHLHVWTTPPFQDKDGYRLNDPNHAFANEIPINLLSEKIKNLTNQVETSFGIRPLSFRSGRYGFNDDLARILTDNHYIIDSSVTPNISWSDYHGIPGSAGGPDFIDKTAFPYKYDFPGGSLLEIPVTILTTKFPLNRNNSIAGKYFRNVDKSIFLKVFRKLFFRNQPLWLRPLPEMNIDLFDEVLTEAGSLKLPFIVMMFHSSELMPGCSKYRPDKDSVEKLFNLLERFFILLQNKNIDSVTLTEAAKCSKL